MSTDELRARISELRTKVREEAERLQAALDVLEAPAELDTRTQGRGPGRARDHPRLINERRWEKPDARYWQRSPTVRR